MKTLTIYKREVEERTGFNFKLVPQFVIYYGGKKILSNCRVNIDDPRLRTKFEKVYESRSFVKFNLLLNDLFKRRDNLSKELYRALKIFDEFTPMKKEKVK